MVMKHRPGSSRLCRKTSGSDSTNLTATNLLRPSKPGSPAGNSSSASGSKEIFPKFFVSITCIPPRTDALIGTVEGKYALAVMLILLAITLFQRLAISPELGIAGRTMGYIPGDLAAQERARFWVLHNAYLAVEAMKFGFGVILAAIVMSRKRSGDPLNQFNMIDKANHRHVNW